MTAATRPFATVLVANRGEVARRVIASARARGLATVAVFSDADADALHVAEADTAVRLGPAPARESYLDGDAVVAAAVATGADAVHPGYGFLAEHAGFARAVRDAGLVWIGPDPNVIALLGDKAAARHRMAAAGVPVLDGVEESAADVAPAGPGDGGADPRDAALMGAADQLAFPVVVKAVAGGGGTGMRLVATPAGLPDALVAARREAGAAFGDDRLLVERAVVDARHVEVQVLGDVHGRVVAVGDRDCSVQRRHQKVVEEAPAPGLSDATRAALHEAATTAAREVGYVGAGTVEFLHDPATDEFHFLEVNTRLQVEHPVTEAVTGLDLVDWQLRIAAGQPLDLPEHPAATGHAIEARLYAEDPAAGFLPSAGRLLAVAWPHGVRVDAGVRRGDVVTTHYDPLLAKLVAQGRDREEARRRLVAALRATTVLGVATNRGLLLDVLTAPSHRAGPVTTTWLADRMDAAGPAAGAAVEDAVVVAAWLHARDLAAARRRSPGLAGWTNARELVAPLLLDLPGGQRVEVTVFERDGTTVVAVGDAHHEVAVVADAVVVDGVRRPVVAVGDGPRVHLHRPDHDAVVTVVAAGPDGRADRGTGALVAPLHGLVVDVLAGPGDRVEAGDPVLVVEAMKMEHVVVADLDGRVDEVADRGRQVAAGDVVARIGATSPSPPTTPRPEQA